MVLKQNGSYLFLLLVEVVNDHTNEEVQGEEGAKNDENDKVDVHVDVDFIAGLVFHLGRRHNVIQFLVNEKPDLISKNVKHFLKMC